MWISGPRGCLRRSVSCSPSKKERHPKWMAPKGIWPGPGSGKGCRSQTRSSRTCDCWRQVAWLRCRWVRLTDGGQLEMPTSNDRLLWATSQRGRGKLGLATPYGFEQNHRGSEARWKAAFHHHMEGQRWVCRPSTSRRTEREMPSGRHTILRTKSHFAMWPLTVNWFRELTYAARVKLWSRFHFSSSFPNCELQFFFSWMKIITIYSRSHSCALFCPFFSLSPWPLLAANNNFHRDLTVGLRSQKTKSSNDIVRMDHEECCGH